MEDVQRDLKKSEQVAQLRVKRETKQGKSSSA